MDKPEDNQKPSLDDETLELAQQLFELARHGNTEALEKPLELGLAQPQDEGCNGQRCNNDKSADDGIIRSRFHRSGPPF